MKMAVLVLDEAELKYLENLLDYTYETNEKQVTKDILDKVRKLFFGTVTATPYGATVQEVPLDLGVTNEELERG